MNLFPFSVCSGEPIQKYVICLHHPLNLLPLNSFNALLSTVKNKFCEKWGNISLTCYFKVKFHTRNDSWHIFFNFFLEYIMFWRFTAYPFLSYEKWLQKILSWLKLRILKIVFTMELFFMHLLILVKISINWVVKAWSFVPKRRTSLVTISWPVSGLTKFPSWNVK